MNKNILIVEDNTKLANYIKDFLEEQGYSVALETRGDQAVYHILQKKPDIIVLDVMLPEVDGKQICQIVRSEYHGKIIMLTALSDIDTEITALNYGADDYIVKPVQLEVLNARITALLRRPTISTPLTTLTFGALTLDLIKKEVTLDQEAIELMPREFELLELLAKSADRVLDRNNITHALQGREYDGVDRSIDLRISRLRKKLKDNLKKPYRIKTIHGKGYVFISDSWSGC